MISEMTKLNDLQISLLRLFNRPMRDDEVVSLKRVLVQHFSDSLNAELSTLQEKKSLSNSDFDAMLSAKS